MSPNGGLMVVPSDAHEAAKFRARFVGLHGGRPDGSAVDERIRTAAVALKRPHSQLGAAREIATKIGLSEHTVRRRLRAMKLFQKKTDH